MRATRSRTGFDKSSVADVDTEHCEPADDVTDADDARRRSRFDRVAFDFVSVAVGCCDELGVGNGTSPLSTSYTPVDIISASFWVSKDLPK